MKDLFDNLEPLRRTGFHLRDDSVQVLGHPLSIEIETRSVPSDAPIPSPNDRESELICLIVDNIDHCINESLSKLRNDASYQRLNEANTQVANPHVWISRELTDEGVVQYCRMLFSKGQPRFPVPSTGPVPEPCDCDDPSCC